VLRGLGLNRTHTLVDLGAGTGAFALAVALYCRGVIAVDVSRPMLSLLTEKAERRRIGNVECVHAGFLSYDHAGEPVDFVYSRNALHHLADFWKALALVRIAAMLKPGGLLRLRDLACSCGPHEVDAVVEVWLAGAAEQPERGWTRQELAKDIREEHITFNWLLESMLARAGFAVRDVNHAASRVFSAYTCVRTAVEYHL
jgi:ubiquinone/menaquinone biosynthesis C-methylase UbiE